MTLAPIPQVAAAQVVYAQRGNIFRALGLILLAGVVGYAIYKVVYPKGWLSSKLAAISPIVAVKKAADGRVKIGSGKPLKNANGKEVSWGDTVNPFDKDNPLRQKLFPPKKKKLKDGKETKTVKKKSKKKKFLGLF